MKGSTESRSFRAVFLLVALLTVSLAVSAPASQKPDCLWEQGDLYAMHWPQIPDLSAVGSEVNTTGVVLADDFIGSINGSITGINVWTSFYEDALPKGGPEAITIELSLYSNIPAVDEKVSASPGERLWTEIFLPGEYTVQQVHQGPSRWYEPVTGELLDGNYTKTYQYSFCPSEPLVQEAGVVYWLSVSIQTDDVTSFFGWKTTGPQRHWGTTSMYRTGDNSAWLASSDSQANPLDLAFVVTSSIDVETLGDLGDAPDSTDGFAQTDSIEMYPTFYGAGSPSHGPIHAQPSAAFFLGHGVSHESNAAFGPDEDGINNLDPRLGISNADADDDGLRVPITMPSCQPTTLDYTLTAVSDLAGQIYVNIWCDWNRDGDWNDVIDCPDGLSVPEWAVQDHQVALPELGTFTLTTPEFLCWHPETTGDSDPLWIRMTVSEIPWAGDPNVGGSGPEGGYAYGETEDYYLTPRTVAAPASYDWGDAPDSLETPAYPTLGAHDGAWHIIGGPWLGNASDGPDAEPNGLPHPDAMGDNIDGDSDENGFAVAPLTRGQSGFATVEVNGGGGIVQAWIDFDGDTAWDPSEEVFNGFLPDGVHSISFSVPQTSISGRTFARCRISTSGSLDPFGPALDGEVEDHEAWIRPVPPEAKWIQWPDATPDGLDVRLDGNSVEPRVLADDFLCVSRDLLTGIRLWGAWENDEPGTIRRIQVSIFNNDPAGDAGADRKNPFAKPGPEVLWEEVYLVGDFTQTLYHVAPIEGQWWWDTVSGDLIEAGQTELWQLDLPVDPNEAFLQTGSPEAPQTYWLTVSVETTDGHFGWRTISAVENTISSAVMDSGVKALRSWIELRYPQGHPVYDLPTNPVDLAFGLMYTPEVIDQPTSRPGSVTQCPAVETKCPATTTNCPAITTFCPVVATQCPAAITQCPTFPTQCPASATSCPNTMTQCPAVETRCPATETQCPTMTTQCPAVPTQCPAGATQCPPLQTQCPMTQTVCPISLTKCPVKATQCPATSTQCPTMTTQCPAVATECPLTVTSCPIDCLAAASLSDQTVTLSAFGLSCPVVDVRCATVTDYLSGTIVR